LVDDICDTEVCRDDPRPPRRPPLASRGHRFVARDRRRCAAFCPPAVSARWPRSAWTRAWQSGAGRGVAIRRGANLRTPQA